MTATYHVGDVLEVLASLEPGSVDMVLTSPPFLALRSYLPADHPDKTLEGGSQSTPGEFIDWLLDVTEALDRVLAPHGSMCVELGDTYAGSGGAGGDYGEGGLRDGQPKFKAQTMRSGAADDPQAEIAAGVHRIQKDGHLASIRNMNHKVQGGGDGWPASKSLTLIPETYRFALAYGYNPHTGRQTTPWRIRNVIRWVRPNPPVGALGDKYRPATSEMVVFCRTDEAGRRRYFDLDAVREPHKHGMAKATGSYSHGPAGGRRSGGDDAFGEIVRDIDLNPAGAPPLDWWNIPTQPYKGAHYATYPADLCVKPIKTMCPERVCVTCGEPSRRIVGDVTYVKPDGREQKHLHMQVGTQVSREVRQGSVPGSDTGNFSRVAPTIGWSDCGHNTWRPGIVLDPFAGSGTTLAVAVGHGRHAIGIDLDNRNVDLARERVGPMFFNELS